MSLGFLRRNGSADFVPWIRYTALGERGGTWSTKERDDIKFHALVDLENIRTGWVLFEPGSAPNTLWDKVLGQPGRRPSTDHKRGICVRLLFSDPNIGLRELITNTVGVCSAVEKIYNEFESAPQRKMGLVPLVECVSVEAKRSLGTIYEAVFSITSWLPRPSELAPPALPSVGREFNDDVPF